MATTASTGALRIYEDEGDLLLEADQRRDRVVLLPAGDPRKATPDRDRIRIQWGQHLLADLLAKRYRTLVCGVNNVDNARGIIAQVSELLPVSQWNSRSIGAYAETFARSATGDDVFVLKYDLDLIEVLALLRPPGRDHFTLADLSRGFRKIAQMIESRRDRLPCASVSFLGAKSNRLAGPDGQEPSFEAVLRTAFESGYRGDMYPPLALWERGATSVFASYPFPASLDRMRQGGD